MQNQQFTGNEGRMPAQGVPQQRTFRESMPAGYTSTGGWQGQNQQPHIRRRPTQRVYLNRSQRKRLLIVLLVLALAAGGLYLAHQRQQAEQYQELTPYFSVYLPNVSVDGIPLSGMTRQEAENTVMAAVAQRQNSWQLDLNYQGHTFITLTRELLGITTDLNQVRQMLDEAYAFGHTGTMEQRLSDLHAASEGEKAFYTNETDMTDEYLNSIIQQISAYFDREPVSAYLAAFDPDAVDPFVIVDDIPGSRLDPAVFKQQILRRAATGEGGDFEIEPQILPAAVTTADIRAQVTLRGEGLTKIATSSPQGRNENISLAMYFINGKTLAPGETFSFNKVVGDRTGSRGFVEAIEYVYGVEVPGVGGGVCQASTTVYLAALLSGLEITERHQHSMKVSYTELGQDATVSGNRLDLCFKNNTSGTLYITAHLTYQPKTTKRFQCVVRIYGQTLGENVNYSLRSETLDVLFPDEPVLRPDNEGLYVVYDDEMYQYQTARDGCVISTYLQKLDNSVVVSEQLISTDTYKPVPDGYYVGVKSRDEEYE